MLYAAASAALLARRLLAPAQIQSSPGSGSSQVKSSQVLLATLAASLSPAHAQSSPCQVKSTAARETRRLTSELAALGPIGDTAVDSRCVLHHLAS